MDNNQKQEILSWLGTPYGHRQCCKGVKVDCLKFCIEALRILGADISVVQKYGRTPRGNQLLEWLTQTDLQQVLLSQPGDALVFNIKKQVPFHMAILIDTDTIIEADIRNGVIISKLSEDRVNSIHSIWRVK